MFKSGNMNDKFRLGALFPDKKTLELDIQSYEKEHCVNLWKKHSRSIASEIKRNPNRGSLLKPELEYSEVTYACVYGGRKHKPTVTTGGRPNQRTNKIDCPFTLKFRSSKDGQFLMLFSLVSDHNHEVTAEEFKMYPSQRRLDKEQIQQVTELCQMQANRKLIRENISERTGKNLVMKDIHNIAGRVKSASSSHQSTCDAKDLARWIKDDYPQLATEFIVLDGQMIGLFMQDPQMKSSFHRFPEVLMVDATHKTSENEMPLYALMTVDGNGESEVVAVFLTKNEDESSLRQMLNIFKSRNPAWEKVKVVVSDKDMAERTVFNSEPFSLL